MSYIYWKVQHKLEWPNLGSMSFRKCKNAAGRNWMAAKDMQKYRRHYPGLDETEMREEKMWNLRFYKNEMCFQPNGLFIEDLLEMWHKDYVILEENHSYIQWLFPLREPGRNWRARLLTCREIQAFKKSKEVMARFVRVYKLMLDFYGIELLNEKTGELGRAENWRERFENLNRFSHNNLRITRMLKCLGELGYENYQVQLVKFFLTEILVHKELPRVLRSALDYFVFTVRNKQQRRELVHFAWRHFTPKRDFVWGPHRKLRQFKPRFPEFLNSERFEGEQDEDGGERKVEQQHETCQRLEEEPASRETGESVEKDQDETLGKTGIVCPAVDQTANNLPEEPVSKTIAELGFSPSGSVPSKVSEGEPSSVICRDRLQAEDAPGTQTSPCQRKVSGKKSQHGLLTAEEVEAEKDSRKEDTPVSSFVHLGRQDLVEEGKTEEDGAPGSSFPQLERQDPADEEGESGASGDSLKECKKRKLEMSRFGEESVRMVKSPTDIEKISANLGEVVIGQKEVDGLLLTEEKARPLLPLRGGMDGRYTKEMEATDAMRKRRKVEVASERGALETPADAGIEIASPESQIDSASTERTDGAGHDATETIGNAPPNSDCRMPGVDLLVNSKSNAEASFTSDSSATAQSGKQETSSAMEGKRLQASETLPFSEKKDVGGKSPGQKGGSIEGKVEEVADTKETPETVESVNSASGPDAE